MRFHPARSIHLAALLMLAVLFASGCARKSVQSPPAVADVPASTAPRANPATTPTPSAPVTAGATTTAADLAPVFFAYDSNVLDDQARATLDRDARLLRENAALMITIEGHCDERGTTDYNLSLGERRAQAAREYLVAAGVDGARLRTISYGKERPFEEGHAENAWSANRRAHFAGR